MARLTDQFFQESINSKEYFDESPRPIIHVSVTNTGSIDTSVTDPWRQGVEIRTFKHFDAGTVKIHSADPGHRLITTSFGLTRDYDRRDPYHEVGGATPSTYPGFHQSSSLPVTVPFVSLPRPSLSSLDLEWYVFDGSLDPLGHSRRNDIFLTSGPNDQRGVRGGLMSGNESSDGCDVLNDIIVNTSGSASFVDAPELIDGRWPTIAKHRSYVPAREAFTDTRTIRNDVMYQSYGDELLSVLSFMSASSENIRPQVGRRASAGWDYGDGVGVDSITFGRMTY